MNANTLLAKLDNLLSLLEKINKLLDEHEKGGPGSGCTGSNCGRPAGHSGSHTPHSGVRPSAVNPNRTEIQYDEEPSSDGRPRSGVRPTRAKPRK